ncbi:MAG TPA: hypothetical protein PKA05_19475 [Roseiflexaceae bacterium]|nr:hypothetical protein [Roseiflexaceae bacterium]HMP42569.1 hypothetical protein [Roseiflexaceae bacterium]
MEHRVAEHLTRQISAGTPLGPWITLGPFYEDCSAHVVGLTLYERAGATVGRAVIDAAAAEAVALLAAAPTEGSSGTFRGRHARWDLVRRPEPYLSWGNYYIANHLVTVLLTTRITPTHAGVRRWRLTQRLNGRALVTRDGHVIFDSADRQPIRQGSALIYEFEAELRGQQQLGIALLRIGRMAQAGVRLELLDGEATTELPLDTAADPAIRSAIEHDVYRLALGRDLFYPEQPVALQVAGPRGNTPLQVTILGPEAPYESGNTPIEIDPSTASRYGGTPQQIPAGFDGSFTLCRAADLPDGCFRIVCEWLDAENQPISSTGFDIRKVTPQPAIHGAANSDARRHAVLSFFAGARDWHPSPPVWRQIARYALGQYDAIDEAELRDLCIFIAERKDCADFAIQGLLRLMAWESRTPRLSPQIHALMKETILGFKYWVDEPGDTVMYMGSENHRLLFHVAEWMAGQLYPLEEFGNSRQRGLFHALKGRTYITEWIRQRGRYGFDEWHSNAYYPICIAPLLNVYDFAIAEDYKLKEMAGELLDVMLFNLAADSYRGTFGTTHGRSYALYCKYAELDDTAGTCWLLWGTGALVDGVFGMAPVSLATSHYRPPAMLYQIANDQEAVVESRQRGGILPGSARHADFVVFRTPDYLLSATQDHRKGEYESSTHVAQLTLPNRAAIFWSCPQTSSEGAGLRPDYWSGNTSLPRAIQQRNLLALHWRLNDAAWMTHCLFEQGRFDEVRQQNGWFFARVENAYVALWAYGGLQIGIGGQYAGRELICTARRTTWLVECGRAADWGDFASFVAAIATAHIESDGDHVAYQSPSLGRFASSWDATPTIDGRAIQLHGYPLVESPWATARFGSGEYVLRYGGEERELWLNM